LIIPFVSLIKDIFKFQKSKLRSKFLEITNLIRLFGDFILTKLNGNKEDQKPSVDSKIIQSVLDNVNLIIQSINVRIHTPTDKPNTHMEYKQITF
jgi:hypothetical protein